MTSLTQGRDAALLPREELERLLEATDDPAERSQLLLKLAPRISRSDYENAWNLAAEGLSIAESVGNPLTIAEGHCVVADMLRYRGKFDEALSRVERAEEYLPGPETPTLEKGLAEGIRGAILHACGRLTESVVPLTASLEIYKRLNHPQGIVRISNVLGGVYLNFWMYEKAASLFLDALSLVDDEAPFPYHGALYLNIGGLYSQLNDYQEALKYYHLASSTYRRGGDSYGVAGAMLNIGIVYEEQRMWEESLNAYMEALSLVQEGPTPMLGILLGNIGTVYEQIGRFEEALEYELRGLAFADEMGMIESQYNILRCLGRLYAKMGRLKEAEEQLRNGLKLAEEAENIDAQYQFHGEFATYYGLIGDAVSALRHTQRGEELLQSTERGERVGKVVRLMAQGELKRLQQEQENLAARVAHLEDENRRQAQELTATALQSARRQEILLRLKKLTDASPATDHTELVSLLRRIISAEVNAGNDEGWKQFERGFGGLHPEFIAELTSRFPSLTPTELKIATLLKVGLTTKEIADVLCISTHTANTHRRRLRRKMGLRENVNLVSFLASL